MIRDPRERLVATIVWRYGGRTLEDCRIIAREILGELDSLDGAR